MSSNRMPTSKEQAEEEYHRMRMEGMKISDDDPAVPSSSDQTSKEPKLDDSISAEHATKLKEEGNAFYKAGDYEKAVEKYSKAAKSAHAPDDDRAVYLANRAAANLKLQRFREVVDDATEALRLKPAYVKALARRKEAQEALKEWRGAFEDAKELQQNPSELRRLQFLADEKEKKDCEEAINSLKGLGNSILSNFGMSLDDLSMEQDPSTGSYNFSLNK